MGYLKLRIEPDDSGATELFAEFDGKGFAGHGSAWFNVSDLIALSDEFARYPLQAAGTACIEGGYWSKGQPTKIEQETLHISAYQTNNRGGIGVRIRAATDFDPNLKSGPKYYVATELMATYEQMARFSRHLRDLVNGNMKEAVLNEADA